jgi:hypothetical protein
MEGFGTDRVDHVAGDFGGLVGGVGVPVEAGGHLVSEAVDERAGVDGGAGVVQVDALVHVRVFSLADDLDWPRIRARRETLDAIVGSCDFMTTGQFDSTCESLDDDEQPYSS